ncbi:hypothetical protein V8E51_008099 [Hyaloscypha variabilis]
MPFHPNECTTRSFNHVGLEAIGLRQRCASEPDWLATNCAEDWRCASSVLYGTANTSLDHNPSGGAAPALGSAVHHINSTDCGRVHVFLEVGLELIAALPNRDNRRRGDKRRSQWRGRAGIDASRYRSAAPVERWERRERQTARGERGAGKQPGLDRSASHLRKCFVWLSMANPDLPAPGWKLFPSSRSRAGDSAGDSADVRREGYQRAAQACSPGQRPRPASIPRSSTRETCDRHGTRLAIYSSNSPSSPIPSPPLPRRRQD